MPGLEERGKPVSERNKVAKPNYLACNCLGINKTYFGIPLC